jgi:biopolymer transport protein ExbB
MKRLVLLLAVCLFAVLGAARAVAEGKESLETAYKREFAFLEAERNSLKQRIAGLDAETQKKIAAAEADVSELQSRVMATSLEADRLNDLLNQTLTEADVASEGDDVLDGLLTQAATALEKGNIKLPELKEGDENAKLEQARFVFTQAISLLDRYGSIRRSPGEFFSAAGKKVKGEILQVGNIASYGISNESAGALAPAGQDELKVWPESPSADTAKALAAGQRPDRLKVFLYESLDKDIEAKRDKTAFEVVDSGGQIAWVIVGLGVLAALLILLRAMFLWRAAANTDKLIAQLTPLVEQGKIADAVKLCDRSKSAASRVLKSTLKHLDRPRDELEDIISESVLHETPFLDRFGSTILVLAAVAPLLGLLGTVTGMISTFDIITEFGTGNPKLLSSGISVALVTTELGLIVAIPALLAGNLLSGWAESIKDAMDKSALRLTNIAAGIRVSLRPPPASQPEPEARLVEA